jgi:hypothetical protein
MIWDAALGADAERAKRVYPTREAFGSNANEFVCAEEPRWVHGITYLFAIFKRPRYRRSVNLQEVVNASVPVLLCESIPLDGISHYRADHYQKPANDDDDYFRRFHW